MRKCDQCRAFKACRHTFAGLWNEKSRNGEGCSAPLTDEHAAAVEKWLESNMPKEQPKTTEQSIMDF